MRSSYLTFVPLFRGNTKHIHTQFDWNNLLKVHRLENFNVAKVGGVNLVLKSLRLLVRLLRLGPEINQFPKTLPFPSGCALVICPCACLWGLCVWSCIRMCVCVLVCVNNSIEHFANSGKSENGERSLKPKKVRISKSLRAFLPFIYCLCFLFMFALCVAACVLYGFLVFGQTCVRNIVYLGRGCQKCFESLHAHLWRMFFFCSVNFCLDSVKVVQLHF